MKTPKYLAYTLLTLTFFAAFFAFFATAPDRAAPTAGIDFGIKEARAESACPAPVPQSYMTITDQNGNVLGQYGNEGWSSFDSEGPYGTYETLIVPVGTVLYYSSYTSGVELTNRSQGSTQGISGSATVTSPSDLAGYYPSGYRFQKRQFINGYTNPLTTTGASISVGGHNSCINSGGPEDFNDGETRISVQVVAEAVPSFTCSVQQSTASVDAGGNTTYTINASGQNGFNSPINFTAGVSPTAGDEPTVSFGSTNGRTPPGPTVATVSTSGNTPATTYDIVFTGTSGSLTADCDTELIVNPAIGDFNLTITPGLSTPSSPNVVMAGDPTTFTVFANCTGGFTGPITSLTPTSDFSGIGLTLGTTTLACGATTTLSVSTGSIPASQLSTPQSIQLRGITVAGQRATPPPAQREANTNLAVMARPQVSLLVNGSTAANVTVGAIPNLTWTTAAVNNGNSCYATNTASDSTWNGSKNGPNGGAQNVGPMNSIGNFTYSIYCDGYDDNESPVSSVQIVVGGVPSYTCDTIPRILAVNRGASRDVAIDVTSLNGFNSPVTFSTEITPDLGTPPVVVLFGNPQNSPYITPTIASIRTFSDTTAGTYQIKFIGTGNVSCPLVIFTVNPNIPSSEIFCNTDSPGPCEVAVGGATVIAWDARNVSTCAVAKSTASNPTRVPWATGFPRAQTSGPLLENTSYYLNCSGIDGAAPEDQVDVIVTANPEPTVELSCALVSGGSSGPGPCIVPPGTTGNLTWHSENAIRCDIDNNIGQVALDNETVGISTAVINGPIRYTITCQGGPGTDRATDFVDFDVSTPEPGAPTVDLTYRRPSGSVFGSGVGGSVTLPTTETAGELLWDTAGAQSCSSEMVSGADTSSPAWTNGSRQEANNTTRAANVNGFVPPASYTFEITCRNSAGVEASDQFTVSFSVEPPPPGDDSFTLSCTPSLIVLDQGEFDMYRLQTTKVGNFNSPVQFRVDAISSIPSGAVNFPNVAIDAPTNNRIPSAETLASVSTTMSTTPTRFAIRFEGTGGGVTRTCTVEVEVEDDGGGSSNPPSVNTDATSQCGKVIVNWNPVGTPTPTGYRVFRGSDPNPDIGAWNDISGLLPAAQRNFTDNSPATSSNYYKVIAYNGAVPSEPQRLAILGNARSCVPVIDRSDKDVTRVVGQISKDFSPGACNANSDIAVLPSNAVFAVGDTVTFKINVCNSGPGSLTGITVLDTLRNLTNPTFANLAPCVSGRSYNAGNNTINFTLNPIGPGDVTPQICSIEFSATVTAPAVTSAALYRFQNIADISSSELPVKRVFTPPYLFSVTGGVPDRNETAPQ